MNIISGNNSAPLATPAQRGASSGGAAPSDRDAFARVLGNAAAPPTAERGMAGKADPSAAGEASARGARGAQTPAANDNTVNASQTERRNAQEAETEKTQAPASSDDQKGAKAEDNREASAKDALANGADEAGRKAPPAPRPAAADAAVDADAAATIPATRAAAERATPTKDAAERATLPKAEGSSEARQADSPEPVRQAAMGSDTAAPSMASRANEDNPRSEKSATDAREAAAAKAAVAPAESRGERAAALSSATAPAMEHALRTETGDKPVRGSQRMDTAERLLRMAASESRTASSETPKAASDNVAMPRALARELESLLAQRSETASIRRASEAPSTPSSSVSAGGFSTALSGVSPMAGGAAQSAPAAMAGGGQPLPSGPPQQLAEMASRVLVDAASEGNWRVTLRLDPPEMGRLDVQISREQGALTAHFVASTAGARAAMEQAMPMLEAQMAEQGMSLADSSVSQQHNGGNGRDQSGEGDQGTSNGWGETGGEPLVTNGATVRRERGLFEGWA